MRTFSLAHHPQVIEVYNRLQVLVTLVALDLSTREPWDRLHKEEEDLNRRNIRNTRDAWPCG